MAEIRAFPSVPILNQPVEVLGWMLIVNVQCRCDRGGVVPLIIKQSPLGRGTTQEICPSCARVMSIQALGMNAHNQLEFNLEVGEPAPAPIESAS